MLQDKGLATEEDRKEIERIFDYHARGGRGCINRRICSKCEHVIQDSICLCIGYFVCPNCGFENDHRRTTIENGPFVIYDETTSSIVKYYADGQYVPRVAKDPSQAETLLNIVREEASITSQHRTDKFIALHLDSAVRQAKGLEATVSKNKLSMLTIGDSLDSYEGNAHTVILNEDGSYETFMVKLTGEGKSFRCEVCGSNCFHKYRDEPEKYYCNSCETAYLGS